MRTKGKILGKLDLVRGNLEEQPHYYQSQVDALIEILIDIRDILKKELKRIDTTETRFIKTP